MSTKSENRKLFIILTHVLGIVAGFLAPLVFLLATEDSLVKKHSRESLNWQISLIIYGAIGFILTIVTLGLFGIAMFALGIIAFVFPIIAAVKASEEPEKVWRYPLTIRFLKEVDDGTTATVVDAVSSETKE